MATRVDEGQASDLDDAGRAAAHLAVAGLRFATGDIGRARVHGASAAAAARSVGDGAVLTEALVLSCMAAAFERDLPNAEAHLVELSEVGGDDAWAQAQGLIARSQVALLSGRLDDCAVALDAAEELARAGAGPFTLGTVLNLRTTLALLADDDVAALRSTAEATELAAEVGTTWTLVYTLSALAILAVRGGRPDLAAELFALVAATSEASLVGVAFGPDVESAEVHLAEVRRQLSVDELERRWTRGRELGIDDVVELIPEISARAAPS